MSTDLKAKHWNTLLKPRITEKASLVAESNVHTFEISPSATKTDVAEAIRAYFKVSPVKIRIVKNPPKKIFIMGKKGERTGVKKAYVYLKKGDKLE